MGLCPSCTRSRERRASPRPSGMRNQASGTSSVQYEVARKERLSASIWYEVSSGRDFVSLVRSRAKRGIVLVLPVRRIKLDFVHLVRSREKEGLVCIRLVRTRSKGGLVPVCLVRGIKQARQRPSGTKSRNRRASPCPFGPRNQAGRTSSVRYEVT